MHIVGVVTVALAALLAAGPGRGAEEKPRAPGYVPFAAFRDCPTCPEMVVLPSGSFEMGSPPDEIGHVGDEAPRHRVHIRAFALGRTEVTQGQWRSLMGRNPSRFAECGDDCPVEQVSWDDAQAFVQALSRMTGRRYRLPSEAEWEYAARAGGSTPFNTGNCITVAAANYDGSRDYAYCHAMSRRSTTRTVPVAGFQANAYGLHDMHGNVWEWVEDCWHDTYDGAPADGRPWIGGACEKRVLRGGSWKNEARSLRCAQRNWDWAYERGSGEGVRVARTLD